MIQIQWHDRDPDTGARRYWRAERFAGQWKLQCKQERRGAWEGEAAPTRETWERILESMQRRYRRRQGVDHDDVEQVEKILAEVIGSRNCATANEERPANSDATAATCNSSAVE